MLGCLVGVLLYRHRWPRPSLPPGPNPIPLLGNLRFPIERLDNFTDWAGTYGPVMTFRVLGKTVIVVNTQAAAFELFEKRSTGTSGRPFLVMAHELVGHGDSPSQTSDPARHKLYRRLFTSALSPRAVQGYWGLQIREMRKATLDMLAAPSSSSTALRRFVHFERNSEMADTCLLIAYGYNVEQDEDGLVDKIDEFMYILNILLRPGEWITDAEPLVKYLPEWFPGAGFKRLAYRWNSYLKEIREVPFERVKRDVVAGRAKPSFCSSLLEEQSLHPHDVGYSEDLILRSAGGIYSAASDTTSSALRSLLAGLVLFPEVQEKAQAELDRVIGRDRAPGIEDRDILPYCAAIVPELLRWQPPTPFALPHVLAQDEEFQGHVLPKNATILGNVWAMSRDPSIYPMPDQFRPERYLAVDEKELHMPDMGRTVPVTFGFGRRVCPGSYLAEATLFGAIVSILWTCTVSRPLQSEYINIEYRTTGVQ
ncbi:cytochrome P450 [Calocera cornea HHB12733]|uniref:Cytochrome P450 n=1 Tax=Calocera cornea HHB12733 TaxID=1353952 RepID=A0A165GUI2_9BASI|nr:cytochrome P450 [Calocera cornea HHB12733]